MASTHETNGQSLQVAILGYGLAGSVFHAPLIAATPGMQVTAIVTSNPERQQSARERYPNVTIYASAEQLWQEAVHYDLVVIATSNKTHISLGQAAMRAGLPVVIDKPMAATVTDAEQLIAVSKETGKLLTVFQNRRWDNDFLTVQKLLAADLLGPITRFESRFERYRPQPRPGIWRESADPADAGGQLYDLGSHLIDQALFLFGQPESVYAEVERRRPKAQVDDDAFVALQFGDGIKAHLWMSQVARIAGARIRVSGLRGTYEKWGLDPQEEMLKAGKRPGEPGWAVEPREQWGRLSTNIGTGDIHIDGPIETIPGAYEQYYAQLRQALIQGGRPPVEPEQVVQVIRIIEAAQQSARDKIVVKL